MPWLEDLKFPRGYQMGTHKVKKGILIDFQVTNDVIAGFCGISTRNSVNRILRGLREQNVISMV